MEFPVYVETGFLKRKAVWIKNPDKHTDAYHVDFRSNSDMVIHRGDPQGPIVGKVDFHKWSGYTELMFEHNQRVEMARDSTFSKTETLLLPASPKKSQFKWKRESLLDPGSLRLEDADGTVLALFTRSHGVSKVGTLTLTVPGLSQEFTDQIFVSFMAVAEKQRRQRQRGAAAAAAGSAG